MNLIVVFFLAAFCTIIAMYIDGKLFDVQRTKSTYIKNTLLVAGMACGAVYFFSPVSSVTASPLTNMANVRYVDGEQILTGMPNF